MGILNATPDSFFSGSASTHLDQLSERAEQLISEGADILDIGGMSSRPGAEIISPEKELERVIPIIEWLSDQYPDTLLSIDTLHSETAGRALEKGVSIINDISGGQYDPEMIDLAADRKVPFVCMHMRGTPKTMKENNVYEDMIRDVMLYFKERIILFKEKGIVDVIIDPGFGFAKNIRQNFQLLQKLHLFQIFDVPVMIGISRKSFIYKTLGINVDDALNGTTIVHTMALQQGVQILRVHDVKAANEVVNMLGKVNNSTF